MHKTINVFWHLNWGICGVWGLKITGKGQGCVAVWYLNPYFGNIILPRRWLVGVRLAQESPKRIIQKKRQQQIRDEDVSFILSFIYWIQQPFHGWGCFLWIHWNAWILQLRCQKYVNRFMHVFVLIWYFGLPYGLLFSFRSLSKSGKG